MMVVKNEVADDWRGDETGKCEDIRNCINILMRSDLSEDFEGRLLGLDFGRPRASLLDFLLLLLILRNPSVEKGDEEVT